MTRSRDGQSILYSADDIYEVLDQLQEAQYGHVFIVLIDEFTEEDIVLDFKEVKVDKYGFHYRLNASEWLYIDCNSASIVNDNCDTIVDLSTDKICPFTAKLILKELFE